MSIFKRDQDPPYNRATAAKPPVGATPAGPGAPVVQRSDLSPAAPAPVINPATSSRQTASGAPGTAAGIPVARDQAAVVDHNTEITGTLHSSGNVLIEGRFHGEVEAKETVWVEKGAQSDGELRASDAVISGAVDGQIDCERRLQIAATAVVNGEIKTPILVIEEGATVNCRFSMPRGGTR